MVAYAKHEFELNKKQKDKCTLRDHLNVAWKATGVKPEQLDYDELPEKIIYVWQWFLDLHQYRGSNGFGANPITPTNIKDWCWLNGIRLEQWEVRAIKMIDNCFLNSQAEDAK